ncbi:MAG: PQQ-binding-like beta-propeller repeat protein, partial [Myxococcota bacterium]
MVQWLLAFAFVLLASELAIAQEAPPDREPERFGVVIGVSDYVDPRIPDVPNAGTDAEAIRDWLTTTGGLAPERVALLLDDGALTLAAAEPGRPIANTRANVLEVTERWLGERARPGDTVFVYFSGQATADGPRALVLPRDARAPLPTDTGLDLGRLGQTLAALEVTPVVWLDTSFAGRGEPTGRPTDTLDLATLFPSPQRVVWLAASPDTVAVDATQRPYGAFTDTLLRSLRIADGRVGSTELQLLQSAAVAPVIDRTTDDRRPLADLDTEEAHQPEVVPQSGHGDAVTALAWHPVEPWLASGDDTGVVQLTDVEEEATRLRLPSGRRGVYRLAFTPSGDTLLVAGRDGVLRAYRTSDGEAVWDHVIGKVDKLTSLAVLADGAVAVGTSRGFVVVVDAATGQRTARFRIGESPRKFGPTVTEGLGWTPDGRFLVSGGENGELSLWYRGDRGLDKWSYQRRLIEGGPSVNDLVVLETRAAVGFATGEVRVLDLADGTTTSSSPSTGYAVRRIDRDPTGQRLAIAAGDIRLWNIADGTEQHLAVASPPTSLAWSLDGATLVSGHQDGSLVRWNIETGQELGRLPGEASGIRRLAVDAGRLVVAGESGATIWDLDAGQLVGRLETQLDSETITSVAMAEQDDQSWVFGGSAEGWLYAWDAKTGEPRAQWPLEAPIRDVSLVDDTLLVATDGFVERVTLEDRARFATRTRKGLRGAEACGDRLVLNSRKGFRRVDPVTGERDGRARQGA